MNVCKSVRTKISFIDTFFTVGILKDGKKKIMKSKERRERTSDEHVEQSGMHTLRTTIKQTTTVQ